MLDETIDSDLNSYIKSKYSCEGCTLFKQGAITNPSLGITSTDVVCKYCGRMFTKNTRDNIWLTSIEVELNEKDPQISLDT